MAAFSERWRFSSLLPLLVWGAVIFGFSQMPGSGLHVTPPLWYVLERKSAHVFEYAVLTLLAYRYLRSVFRHEPLARVYLAAATLSLVYGVLDELHQFFIFGRGARFTDVAVDALGITVGIVLIAAFQRIRR